MELILIRHTAVAVPFGTCYGQSDVQLKNSFEEEAEIVKSKLKEYNIGNVYTSPLSRCTRLADYCGYNDAERDDRLKEMFMGDWEMQMFNDINDPQLLKWGENYYYERTTNGESFEDMFKRVSSFLDEIKEKEKNINKKTAIFAHGGVLLSAQLYSGNVKIEGIYSDLTPYGGIIELII
jgi:alpha-ribazole phosphatase